MVTTPDSPRKSMNEAVSEAIRATSEVSHLTLGVFNAYALAVEAAIKGSIAVQNAMFAAGMSFLDASTNSSRNVVQQWTEATHQAQQATLEVWQASAGAGDRLLASSAETAEQAGREETRQRR